MSDYRVKGTDLASVADAIRTKGGTSESLSFPDGFVSAVQNIPTGGGSTLIAKSITANGTYNASSDNADGYSSVNVAVPSRAIIGTFTASSDEKGAAKNIALPYTGSGYPISGIVFPSYGTYNSESELYDLVHQYAIAEAAFSKSNANETPTYSTEVESNLANFTSTYKSSASDNTQYTRNGYPNMYTYVNADAREFVSYAFRLKDSTTMSVYIASDSSPGFIAEVEYTYVILYSE